MDKSNKKSTQNWNPAAINALAAKYCFTKRYIKQILAGDRTPIFADRIQAEYKDIKNKLENILSNDKL